MCYAKMVMFTQDYFPNNSNAPIRHRRRCLDAQYITQAGGLWVGCLYGRCSANGGGEGSDWSVYLTNLFIITEVAVYLDYITTLLHFLIELHSLCASSTTRRVNNENTRTRRDTNTH